MFNFSIITLNWNRNEDLRETLNNITQQHFNEYYEVIVVDNGSTDGSLEMLEEEFRDLRIIKLTENTGIRGYNVGIRNARGNYIILIDNDMIFKGTDNFNKIKKHFNENDKLGAVAFQIIDLNTGEVSFNSPKYILSNDGKEGFKTSVFDGGGVAIRKDILEKVGYYPEEFFMYQTEIDLSTRIWNAGFEIRYFPDVTVIHKWSPKSRNKKLFLFLWHRNYLWYVFKYFPLHLGTVELFMFIVVNIAKSIREKYFTVFVKALFFAFISFPRIYKKRERINPNILKLMQKIRIKHYLRENKLLYLKPKKRGILRFLFWKFYYESWRIDING